MTAKVNAMNSRKRKDLATETDRTRGSVVTVIKLCFFYDVLKLAKVPSEEKMNKRRRRRRRRRRRNESKQRF